MKVLFRGGEENAIRSLSFAADKRKSMTGLIAVCLCIWFALLVEGKGEWGGKCLFRGIRLSKSICFRHSLPKKSNVALAGAGNTAFKCCCRPTPPQPLLLFEYCLRRALLLCRVVTPGINRSTRRVCIPWPKTARLLGINTRF